ncbi:NarK family nitrate/nitrite MFS transporter [Shewanella halifaxensis]|uniref:NarK family nitrate/nitrite MFS transporter n=1 Tax=Shewanella halifaxensis TaxID=271098 RepID=UPI000D58E3E6|nr:NarK family nitrate/nitrite MFS transporter [Shewanella halifaxensis]
MANSKFNLFRFSGKMKILHLSWCAFFITFLVWFNVAPLLSLIAVSLDLTQNQLKTLLILNVALTIPARVIIGMLTDRFGPKRVYSLLLFACSVPCFIFAFADNFEQLAFARFLLGCIGAGFVIGIRMISEWFPVKELGLAQGIYAGWGNFGSAAAALTLPTLAILFGGENGWRYAIGITGVISLTFAFIYYINVTDTPKGASYYKTSKINAIAVTSKRDLYLLLIIKLPIYAALALLTWKLSPSGVAMLTTQITYLVYVALSVVMLSDFMQTIRANKSLFSHHPPEHEHYDFKQVAVLCLLYFSTFGSELAVVSMLPLFFAHTFEVGVAEAGILASSFAFMNLMSRPAGGWLSDRFGRKPILFTLTVGLALSYFGVAQIDSTWSISAAILLIMLCSFFVQSGEGAVFAVVPLIKRRFTGQIAGITGAYGNAGAVFFLTVYSITSVQIFFYVITASAVLSFIALFFMTEPQGYISESNENGTITRIPVG